MNSERVIVTGANGFIGKALTKALEQNGTSVTSVVRSSPGSKRNVIVCDPSEIKQLPTIIDERGFDCFFHLAWSGTSGNERKDLNKQLESIESSIEYAHVAKGIGCKRFVFAGSIAELTSEDDGRTDHYGVAKTFASNAIEAICKHSGIDFIKILLPSTYGEGLTSGFVYNVTLDLIKNKPIELNSQNNVNDFVHISDVVNGIVHIGKNGIPFKPYFIGTGNPRTISEFVRILSDLSDSGSDITFKNEISSLTLDDLDISPLLEDTGYSPSVPFDKGASDFVRYMRSVIP